MIFLFPITKSNIDVTLSNSIGNIFNADGCGRLFIILSYIDYVNRNVWRKDVATKSN